jgi:hypothetical protein
MAVTDGTVRMDEGAGSKEVLRLLREQADLYVQLEALAARQQSLVSDDDVGPLLSVLADRQKLSARLTQVARRLAPLRRDWDRYRAALTPAERDEAEEKLRDASERLQRIIESDERDARVLSGRKQAVAAALRSTHVQGSAMTAYRSATGRPGRLDCTHDGV